MDEIIWPEKLCLVSYPSLHYQDGWNDCLTACKSVYEKHKPGKGLERLDEEIAMDFLARIEDAYIHNNPLAINRRRFLAKAICARFAAPSLPTVKKLIRVMDETAVRLGYPTKIDYAYAILALLTNPAKDKT